MSGWTSLGSDIAPRTDLAAFSMEVRTVIVGFPARCICATPRQRASCLAISRLGNKSAGYHMVRNCQGTFCVTCELFGQEQQQRVIPMRLVLLIVLILLLV